MPDGLVSLAEAVAQADSELGTATPSDPQTATPGGEEELLLTADQAEAETHEQPEEGAANQVDELFDEELIVETEQIAEAEAPGPVSRDQLVEIPGEDNPVTIQQLIDERMMQRDYTRKTQALAEERAQHADAVKFWDALQENPGDVVKALAVKAGLITADVKVDIPVSPFQTPDEVEAEVERRVSARLEEHPEVQEARRAAAVRLIDDEFSRLEDQYSVKLGPKSREAVLAEARRTRATDLEVVFLALRAKQDARRKASADLQAAGGSKPSGGVNRDNAETVPDKVDSFLDAALIAERELAEL